MMPNTLRRHRWLTFALFGLGFILVFRGWLFSGFDRAFGDLEDGYIALALVEHWHHVFSGGAHWTDPIFFYPQHGVLGFTDAYFLIGLFHAPLRMLGVDAFTAFMVVMTALAIVGFFGFRRLASRHFGLPSAYCSVGAFLFAFGNVDAVKLIHAQSYCAMLLPSLCDLALSGWSNKRFAALLGGASGLLYAALFLTAFQTAWFFGCAVLVLALLHPLIQGRAATCSLITEAFTSKRTVVTAAAGGFVVGIVPSLSLYLPVLFGGHSRSFAEVVANMPDWRDLANVTPDNALWGALLKSLAIAGRPDRPVWEVELAFTPAVLATFLVGTIVMAVRVRRLERGDRYVLMCGAVVVISWLLQTDYFGFRPWHAVWMLIPGGQAIRYPFRSQLVANLFVALVVVRVLAAMTRRAWARLVLGAVLVVEQVNTVWPATVSRRAAMAWIQSVPPPPPACRFFYLMPRSTPGNLNAPQQQAAAMLFSELRNIPTINGASSWVPDGWTLDDPAAPGYAAAVRTWAATRDIGRGLCGVDFGFGLWHPGLP